MTPRFLNLATYRSWKKSAGGLAITVLMCCSLPLYSITTNWTAGSTADFNWATGANWSAGVPTAADDAFLLRPIPNPGFLANPHILTLGAGSVANSLTIRDNYTLTGGDLALTGGAFRVDLGMLGTLNTQLTGAAGLTLTGGGTLRLTNAANNYMGITTISNGSVVISNPAALGTDPSAIVVTGSATRGFGGGSLVLDGAAAGFTVSRNLSLQGLGPITDRGAALVSVENNTLSGTVTMGTGLVSTRAISASGTLTLSGALDATGTAGTTISTLGGVNQAGATFYSLTGALTGTGTLDKSGGGTLFLTPSSTAGFSGTVRVSGSAGSGQSSTRITSNGVLGTRTASGTGGVLDMNGGILEVRMDSPLVQSGGANANVYGRASSTLFADHSTNGTAINGTVNYGNLTYEDNITLTFNSRNGYGMSFTTAPVNGGDNPSTFTNNVTGLLTFTGNFWSNSNDTANRTVTINGTGSTLISGSLIASAASFDHNLTKAGASNLTISGISSTLDGNVNIQAGSLTLTDFRSVNNNVATVINVGNTTTAGTLNIGTSTPASAAGLTSSRTINLSGTTGGANINANQAGANPVVINTIATTGAGAKTLTLGGTSTADNAINGVLADNGGALSLVKTDAGTWVLGGNNTYTGATTISNGTLKLRATAAASNIINSAAAVTFNANATTQAAGGALEFAGQNGTSNVESLGALTPTAGMGTVRLTPGAGGTASLTFSSLGTVNNAAGVNFITPNPATSIITLTGQAATTAITLPGAGKLYINGADFARINASAQVVAPVYDTDGGFVSAPAALTAASHNLLTGSYSQAAVNVSSLKLTTDTLTLTGFLGVKTAGANDSGGILQTGGTGAITGTGVGTGAGTGSLVIRVNGASDVLNLDAPITTTTGGLTKNGAGALVLSQANTQTGTTTINEGTIRLSGAGVLSAASQDLTIRQGGTFDLNGVSTGGAIKNLVGAGTITNSNAAAATLTIGNGTPAASTFSGTIQNGSGVLSVFKRGTANFTFSGLSTYTGSTIIESTGALIVNTLADIGQASGIGAGNGASAATNAASLVFQGPGASPTPTLQYTGTTSVSTNRLFTLDMATAGSIAQIVNNSGNNSAIVFSNTAAIPFGVNATVSQTLALGGSSTADNAFFPQITDNGALVTNVVKTGAGQWVLANTNNTYTGTTAIAQGTLIANDGTSLPNASGLLLGATTTAGVLQTSGNFTRNVAVAAAANTVTWNGTTGGGGFAASDSKLVVALGGLAVPTPLQWGTGGFVGTGGAQALILGSATALAEVEFRNPIDLNGALRTIQVDDNGATGADFASISGVISGAAGGISKTGTGILALTAANTYGGTTEVTAGTIVVSSLGASGSAGATSVGDQLTANTDASAIVLGNATTTGGILQYVGPGETSDRKIRLNGTTANNQIHADGSGPLILSNVAHDTTATGAKTLSLRGTNAAGNMITSALNNNGAGVLGVTVDGSATWILTNGASAYSGTTTVSAGALGIGANTALGTSTVDLSNGSIFAYGDDRSLSNAVRLANNTTTAAIGDYSLTFAQPLQLLNAANNTGLNNNIVGGERLTFGGATANSLPNNANRTWTIDGAGETFINGDITTTQTGAGGLNLTKTGNGLLILGGAGGGVNNYNRNNASTDIDRGTLRLGASEVIGHGLDTQGTPVAYGALILSPELAAGDTATFDLNGFSETVNSLTATTDGTATIDNTSGTAATLTFGTNNATVNFGTGAGTYSITDSGAGALSLVKTGTGTANIGTGTGTTTLTYQGTTSVNGGIMNIASALNGTTALNVTNTGSALNITGGLTTPAAITSVIVDGGASLSIANGAANAIGNLSVLDLGAGLGTAILGMDLGVNTAGSDRFITGGAANALNTIQFNITALPGFGTSATYDLLSAGSGLLGGGAFYSLGSMPGGFTYGLSATDSLVQLNLTPLAAGDMFWRGDVNGSWSALFAGFNSNFSTDLAGTIDPGASPGAANTVIFSSTAATGPAIATTLDNPYAVNALKFTANPAGVTSVTIASGTGGAASALTIAPALTTDGIDVADNAGAVTISAPVVLGTNQTWNVVGTGANGSSLTLSGAVSGTADVTKTGAGAVTLSADNPGYSGITTISGGTVNIGAGGATGAIGTGNIVNNGALVVNRTGTITLGQLISGTGTLTKSGTGVLTLNNGANSYTGTTTVTGGTISFTSIGNVGAGPTALGAPADAVSGTISLGGTLDYIGGLPSATDRLITLTASSTLSANSALITYNGAIAGGAFSLTLSGATDGVLAGALTQTAGGTNDLNKSGAGAWTLTATNTIADDLNVTAGTLNINAVQAVADDMVFTGNTSIVNINVANAHQGDDLFIRDGAVVNLGVNGALSTTAPGMDALNIAENATAANAAKLDLKGFTSTVAATTVGFNDSATGQIVDSVGGGVLTASSYTVRHGLASANLAGAGGVTKNGDGIFTLSGTNTFTGASTVTEGQLILDYTTNNTSKIAAAAGLTLGGAAGDRNALITFNGNAAAPSTQAFTTLTVISGASDFVPVSNGGQAMNVNFTTITRTAAGGTVDFAIPAVGSITTTQALNNGILGGFATVNNGTAFATKDGSNNIIAAVPVAKDNVTAWLLADNVTDTTGFTGILADCSAVNSITFTQPGSTVNVGGSLGVNTGGIMVSSTATGARILGGRISSGGPDIIVHQHSASDFEISSAMRSSLAVTKNGNGALLLSGTSTSTGAVTINEGVIKVSGGNAIGNNAAVNFKDAAGTGLTLLASETIGTLSGGGSLGGTISLGANTLTINNAANTTYSGSITGNGSLVKQGASNLALSTVSNSGFTGSVVVNQGLLFVNGNGIANLPNASSVTVNPSGSFMIDNNGATAIPDRLANGATVTLNSQGNGSFFGIHMRGDQDVSATEIFGALTLAGGSSAIGVNQNGGTNRTSNMTFASINRQDNATIFLDGRNLAATAGNNRGRIVFATAPALVGGTGVAGSTTPALNAPILRYAVTLLNTANIAVADVPNTFASYTANGVTPLLIATEYQLDAAGYAASADATDNLRFTTGAAGLAAKTFNAVVFDSTAAAMTVSGAGGGGNVLTVGSGAMLFTSTVLANGTIIDTFDGLAPGTGSSNEWIITVANTTATINSVLNNGAGATILTKSGTGTLVLGADNAYTGGTVFNQGAIQADTLARLGPSGDLRFQGGALRFGGVFDPSARSIILSTGGGTFDTNGNDITFASTAGSGVGGLTKAGAGNLTLNAAATYTGATTVSAGTLTVGANNATGNGGDVNVAAGATLALGANSITAGLVTTSGASPVITGAGTINTGTGVFFNHTGDTTVDATIAGAGGVLKAQANVVTLTAASTYTGATEIQAGALSINTIGNVGAGPSALGNPTTVENGIIRMGLTTVAGALTYTGSGHTSDRQIALQGTTGGATIDADGTGALVLTSGAHFETGGNKTLTLRGSSLAAIDNQIGLIDQCDLGVLTLAKADSNTWLLTAANQYTGATQIDDGTLKIGVNDSLPTVTAVRLGTGTTAGTLDLNGFNQTIASLTSNTNSTTATNQIIVDAGNTLTINGAVTLGANVDVSTTLVTASGGGAIVVNSGGANFQVGGATGGTNENTATVDFTGLASFTANLGTGTFRIGDANTASGTAAPATMKLAPNSTITAANIRVGDSSGFANNHTLTLGSGANLLNGDTINVGSAAAGIRSSGTVNFDPGDTTGAVQIRASDGTSRALINMVNTTGSTTANMDSTINLAGHTADILASTLTMAARTANTGGATATLTFDQGTMDITTLNMASRTGAGTGGATATVNLGDSAALGSPTTTIGAINMAVNTSGGGTVIADLNITGGTVNSGPINMANAGASRTVTSTIDLTGGSMLLAGNITRTGGPGTENATVTVDGGTLDMNAGSIGSGTAAITLVAASGVIRDLGELNGGGAFNKTTAGTLTLEGVNTHTGDTTVTAGTLVVNNAGGSGTGSGSVTVNASTFLAGNGSIAPAAGENILLNGETIVGIPASVVAEDFAMTITGASTLAFNNLVRFDIFANAQTGTLNPLTANDLMDVSAPDWTSLSFGAGSTLKVDTLLATAAWVHGDAWKIFDWAGIAGIPPTVGSGGFATIDLPALTGGQTWDTSQLYTTGVISINAIPEPSRALLLFIGLLGVFFRRRR